MTRWYHTGPWVVAFLALMCAWPMKANGQQTPQPPPAAPQDIRDTTQRVISPRTALFRSLLIPGWGQASVRAYTRGGVFFATQSASWYMLLKTLSKLGDAQDIEERRIAFISDTLRARMALDTALARQLADPVVFRERVESDSSITRVRNLIEARKQQRQDWVTYTLFFTFASCVDAFVAAQLADFPAAIEARPRPAGGLDFQVSVPFPRKQ